RPRGRKKGWWAAGGHTIVCGRGSARRAAERRSARARRRPVEARPRRSAGRTGLRAAVFWRASRAGGCRDPWCIGHHREAGLESGAGVADRPAPVLSVTPAPPAPSLIRPTLLPL